MPIELPTKTVETVEINHEIAGDNVRELREALGKSLRWLAKKIGVSAPFLSDLERGRRNWSAERYDKAMTILRKVKT